MLKVLIIIAATFFSFAILFLVLYRFGVTTILGSDCRLFGYLCLSIAIFSGGFLNLIAFRKGIKKGFNIGMMVILFVGGAFGIFIEILDIIENFQKLK
jgi:hypothetical protein